MNVSPTVAASFMNDARLASIDIHSVTSWALKAQASTTCIPWALMTLMPCPAVARAALPRRDRDELGAHGHSFRFQHRSRHGWRRGRASLPKRRSMVFKRRLSRSRQPRVRPSIEFA
jgi:hypothetical protein